MIQLAPEMIDDRQRIDRPDDDADPRDPTNLPPLEEMTDEENWAAVTRFMDVLEQKGVDFFKTPCDQADVNLKLLEVGKCEDPSPLEVISNKIRTDVYTIVNGLLRESPTKTIEPEENGEPPEMVPLSQPMQMGVDEMTGLPILSNEFPIDDTLQAKFEQKLIDKFWDDADLDTALEAVAFNSRIAGWYIAPYDWDRQADLPRIYSHYSVRQTVCDPNVNFVQAIETGNWSVHRARINYWQAKAMFPHLAKEIRRWQDTTLGGDNSILQLGRNQTQQTDGENMVDLKFCWLRNFPVKPMLPDEALEYGEIETREVADESQIGLQGDGAIDESAIQQVLATPEAGPSADQIGSDNRNGEADAANGAGGVPVSGDATDPASGQNATVPQFPTRTAFYLPNGQTEITPASQEWPMWTATIRITRIGDAIAEAIPDENYDVPLLHLCANPIPLTPCGQGDPQAMQSLQEGRNRALTNAVEHADLMAHPVQVFPNSAWAVLPEKYKADGASISGMQIQVPDDVYQQLGGKMQITEQGEPISPALTQIIQLLTNDINDDSQGSKAQQGKLQSEDQGWQTTQMLLQAANSKFDLPAKLLEKMVRRAVKLVRHSILFHARLSTIMRICSEYPPEVVVALIMRGRRSDANIKVTVNVSSGGVTARKVAESVQKFQMIDEMTGERVIGMDTLRDRLSEDNAKEREKQGPALQAAAQAKAAAEQAKLDAKKKPGDSQAGSAGPTPSPSAA